MKRRKKLIAAALALSMLLSLFGGGVIGAAAATVTTGSELAFDPLTRPASVAYEEHEDGYTVTLDRSANCVTMAVTPKSGGSRSANGARLYVRTGVELKAGTAYQVSFDLSAERDQPEYAVRFDGETAQAAYGRLEGRGIKAGDTDRVTYSVTPQKAGGELILCLLLGKTGTEGNTFRFSGLAVGEAAAPEDVTGENVMLVDSLDYSAPGAVSLYTNTGSRAAVTSSTNSATLTILDKPKNAEVWETQLKVATGFKPEAGKTYRVSANLSSTATGIYEVCY